jgi:hypothetical protein
LDEYALLSYLPDSLKLSASESYPIDPENNKAEIEIWRISSIRLSHLPIPFFYWMAFKVLWFAKTPTDCDRAGFLHICTSFVERVHINERPGFLGPTPTSIIRVLAGEVLSGLL